MLLGRMKSATSPLREILRELHSRLSGNHAGTVADYIPELATANPNSFGLALCTADGQIVEVGDCGTQFTIQSVSKPFMFGLAIEDHGVDHVLTKVGVEPTGEAFNAIVLDEVSNRPYNPMVNAGAIATADLIQGKDYPERVKRMVDLFSKFCGRDVFVDNSVFMSERLTGHRNRAMAHLMRNFGMMGERFEEALELYFQQCSILVTAHDLAIMGATLANGGVNPITKTRALQSENVKYLLSIMMTCGMYDFAGEWAFRVGIPAKSGVAGGIVAVVPGVLGIGLYSPRLDAKGNSVRGVEACKELSQRFGLHAFESHFSGEKLMDLFALKRGR
ncbi:MAG: glutaminase A [Planctomyces sp.]|nr:glutaminase A [Planctomyces sp.]